MKAMSLRMSMQTLSPGLTPSECRPAAMRSARSATSSWLRRRLPLMMPWKREVIVAFRSGVGLSRHRHSGAMRSIEPGISRFRVLALRARNDGLPRFREPRRALFHIGADGFGLVGAAEQFLLLDRF